MRPISGSFDPYGHYDYPPRRTPGAGSPSSANVPSVRQSVQVVGDAPVATDVEISIRLFADGGSITVRRHTVADPDGSRRTIAIDALIR